MDVKTQELLLLRLRLSVKRVQLCYNYVSLKNDKVGGVCYEMTTIAVELRHVYKFEEGYLRNIAKWTAFIMFICYVIIVKRCYGMV